MPSLRILHVTPYFADAWAYGGIPRVVSTLTRGLARRGHAVTVCTTDARDGAARVPPGEARTAEGVDVRVFPNFSNRLAYHLQLFLPIGFDTFLRAHAAAFDVAHLHACRNLPGVIAARRLRAAGVPYVLQPNGTAPLIERRRVAKRIFDLALGRRVIADAARIVAVSRAEREQFRALHIDPDVVALVPNPVDLDEFRRPPARGQFRNRFSLESHRVVLFLGKLTPRKRVDVLMRAFAHLAEPDARLVIAGNDMGAESGLRALARSLGIDARAIFTGLLRGEERLEALADADVAVYPSQDEIFGLVALEAILAGTPVIVSDDSGCGEVVRSAGGGELVPVGDAAALAAAIERALHGPAARPGVMAQAADRVRALYGDDIVCARFERLYSEIVEGA
jgi:glycosyltransferase involved in cell wall biosynthesis